MRRLQTPRARKERIVGAIGINGDSASDGGPVRYRAP